MEREEDRPGECKDEVWRNDAGGLRSDRSSGMAMLVALSVMSIMPLMW